MKIITKCLVSFLILTTQSANADINWPRWRGPNNNGSITSGNYPVKWDSEKVLWKIEVPGKGFSTPIVSDKKIYLTTGTKDSDTVLAFDWSGEQIWQQQLGSEVAGKHRNGSGSNPSATTDGSAVYVFSKVVILQHLNSMDLSAGRQTCSSNTGRITVSGISGPPRF